MTDDVAHITLHLRPHIAVADHIPPRTGSRLTVMFARFRCFLRPEERLIAGESAIVHQREHDPDVMTTGNTEKLIDARQQTVAIGLPDDKRQIDTQLVIARFLCPAEFLINHRRIKSFTLPQFGPVNRRARQIIKSANPALLLTPRSRLFPAPLLFHSSLLMLKCINSYYSLLFITCEQ